MSSERDGVRGNLYAGLGSDVAGLAGFAYSRYLAAQIAEEGSVALLGGLLEIAEGTVLASAIVGAGGIFGAFAIMTAPALLTLWAFEAASDDSRMGDISSGLNAVGFVTPTTLLLAPISPLISPSSNPFLTATVWGARGDAVLGVVTAGSIGEVVASVAGSYITMSQPDYEAQAVQLQNYWSSGQNSFSPSPGPTPSPAPGPTPSNSVAPGAPSGGGIDPDMYPIAPGAGDFWFGASDGGSYGDGGYSGSFNGDGFTVTTTIGVAPAPPVDPPVIPDPPDPPELPSPITPPTPITPTPPPPSTPTPPPGDDDDDDS